LQVRRSIRRFVDVSYWILPWSKMQVCTGYHDHHALVEGFPQVKSTPSLLIRRYARDFHGLADKFRKLPAQADPIKSFELCTACGELLMRACKDEVLPDVAGRLHALVKWHMADDRDDPKNLEARCARCPYNLFIEVVGGHLIPIAFDAQVMTVVGKPYGGVMPSVDPGMLSLEDNEQYARTSEWLADVIEDNCRNSNSAVPESAEPIAGAVRVDIGEPGMPCCVMGKKKKPLTDAERAVVEALMEAGREGIAKDAIEIIRPSARRIMRNLKRDPDWNSVILMAKQTNGRYRILP
jgi:hypothetical protein